MGILGGKTGSGNPNVALAIWNLSGGTPGSLRGATSTMSVTNTIVDATTGQVYFTGFATPIPLYSGTAYALGYLSTGAGFGHVMRAASYFDNGNGTYSQPTTFYYRDRAGQPPTDPMGYTSNDPQGVIDIWLEYAANRAPTAAIVAPIGSVNSAAPAMQFSFSDADTSYGDKLKRYGIQVRRKSDSVSFMNIAQDASPAETAAGQTNYPYNGTTLVAGTTYQSRAYVLDQFSTSSAWTAWTDFLVNAGGTVTAVSPSGKQNVNTGLSFTADWTHANTLSTQAVQIQLLQNTTVVQDSGSIARTVVSSAAPGTAFTITWAQARFATLAWGTPYTYQIRGQDTGGLWSAWSTPQIAFATDYYPNVPTGLSPAHSLPTSSPPILTATMIDPDDTAAGTLTNMARVKAVPQLVNGGFATDIFGWTGSNTGDGAGATVATSYDTTVYPAGALKVASSASTAASGNVYHITNVATWIPVVTGETYTIRATYQTDTANLHPRIQFRWYNAALVSLGTNTEPDWAPAINTNYPRSFSYTPPVNAVYLQVAVQVTTAAANVTGNLYFDAISVDQGTRFKRAMAFNSGPANWTYQTAAGTTDVFTLSATGASSGTVTLNVDGAVSATLASNVSAATAQTTLQALTTVGAGNLICTGGPLNTTPIVCTWANAYAGTYKNVPTIGTNALVGAPPTIAHTTSGAPADLAHFGAYAWDCAGNDGTLQGSYPTQANFIFGNGPTVVITAPVANSTLTTATPTVTWTAPGQVSYRIQLFSTGTTTVAYDSGTIVSAAQSVAIPGGFLHGSPSTTYDLTVSVINATPLTGTSSESLTIAYTAPDANTNFRATPTLAGLDAKPSSVLCSWDQTTYAAGVFVQYLLDRRNGGTSPGDASTVTLAKYTSPSAVAFVDYLPVADQPYTYSLRQQVTQGTDTTESGRVEVTTSVSLVGIVLCAALNGGTYRAVLSYASARTYEHHQDTQTLIPWGATAPTILIGTQNYQTLTGSFTLVADTAATAASYIAGLRAMYAQRLVICVRDERDRLFFGVMISFKESDARLQQYTADITISECSFSQSLS